MAGDGHGSGDPTEVSLAGPAAAIGVGDVHSCAALINGDLYCWGENNDGEVGIGSEAPDVLTPTLVTF